MIDYLTTHDIVWINTTVTGTVNRFDYIALEAAMAAQYQYGDSRNVTAQAANFLQVMLTKPAFSDGALRTALIGAFTFLNANGYATKVTDAEAVKILVETARQERTPQDAIDALVAVAETPLKGVPLRTLITHECNLHLDALKTLAEYD